MRALRFHAYGGPEVLQFDDDVPVPEPGEGQVLIKTAGFGINPYDWKLREGIFKDAMPVKFPVTVGNEFSGTIERLGLGVSGLRVGDEVYGSGPGAGAEYLVATATSVAPKPGLMDLPDAAAVPIGALTAWQALFDVAKLKTGQRVLIQAAVGGVGSFAVQLAKWEGAYVIGTSSGRNRSLAIELGVDHFIDYTTTRFEDVATSVDVVLETLGGDNPVRSLKTLKPGGIEVVLAAAPPTEEANAQGKRAVSYSSKPDRAQLIEIGGLITDLKVRPIIDTVSPFDEAVELFKEIQAGHTVGKLVARF